MSATSNPSKTYVAGRGGTLGGAIVRALLAQGVPSGQASTRTLAGPDLTEQCPPEEAFSKEKSFQVHLAAAKVSGIHANNPDPADYGCQNLMVQANVIQDAHFHGLRNLIFLGSSCIYPRTPSQPMREIALLIGTTEPTKETYAMTKFAGIKLHESYNRQHEREYRCVLPSNLYGLGESCHPERSHVIPSPLRRFYPAVEDNGTDVAMWDTGTPTLERLYADEMVAASVFAMNLPLQEYEAQVEPPIRQISVSDGEDVTATEPTHTTANLVGYGNRIAFVTIKLSGTLRKLMDSSRLQAKCLKPTVTLEAGLRHAYRGMQLHGMRGA